MTYNKSSCTFSPMSDPKPKLTSWEVAERYGIKYRFVRHLVAERRIPFYKVGKSVLFDPDELDAWFADQKVEVDQ